MTRFGFILDGRAEGRTGGCSDGWTDGWMEEEGAAPH